MTPEEAANLFLEYIYQTCTKPIAEAKEGFKKVVIYCVKEAQREAVEKTKKYFWGFLLHEGLNEMGYEYEPASCNDEANWDFFDEKITPEKVLVEDGDDLGPRTSCGACGGSGCDRCIPDEF